MSETCGGRATRRLLHHREAGVRAAAGDAELLGEGGDLGFRAQLLTRSAPLHPSPATRCARRPRPARTLAHDIAQLTKYACASNLMMCMYICIYVNRLHTTKSTTKRNKRRLR